MMDLVNRGIWLCRHPEYLTCEETPKQDGDIETIIKYGVQSVSEYCSFYGKNYVVSDHIKATSEILQQTMTELSRRYQNLNETLHYRLFSDIVRILK